MALTSVVKAINLSSFNAAGLVAGYNVINTGLSHSCFKLRIINASNVAVGISYDGINTNDFVLSLSSATLDFQNNAGPSCYMAQMSKGTKIYLIGAAGVGMIYLAGYYQN
jgi:hypothetical protein